MRFLQLVTARGPAAVRNPEAAKTIREAIAAGRILATGGLGKRTTAAARVSKRGDASRSNAAPPSPDPASHVLTTPCDV
jgi:hypothetical protein